MSSVSDAELLYAYMHRGDTASLSVLIERHTIWLTAFLRSMLSTSDADDIFQEVWIRVIKSAGRYRGGNVKAYIASIAHSAAIDRLRREGRLVSLDSEDDKCSIRKDLIPSTAPSPLDTFVSEATFEDVYRAISLLSVNERQIVLLRIEAELTFKEIAKELSLPLGTVLTRMRSAIKRLKEQLGEEYE